MRYLSLFLLFVMTNVFGMAGKSISLAQIVNNEFKPEVIAGIRPLNDGGSFARISDDNKRILKYSYKTGSQIAVLFDAEKAKGEKIKEFEDYILSPDESRILIQTQTTQRYRRSKTAVYYIYDVANNKLEPLSKGGPQEQPLFSPDGNVIAFARENNLFLVKLLFNNSESQVTTDGKLNEVINGIPDWVNEEEFSTSRSFDFSADSKMLAWIRYDERNVRTFDMPLYKGSHPSREEYGLYPGKYSYKYPKAGEENSRVSVLTYDIKSHVTRRMEVPMDSDGYVPRIKFTSTPDQLAIITLNRHQSRMDVYMGNARSRLCKLAVREENDKYVSEKAYTDILFKGNHFAMMSDRSGYRHLYWYTTTGQLVKQITSGKNEVVDFYGYNEADQNFYYRAYDNSPLRTAVFKTDLKGRTRKLSSQEGTNTAVFSKSFDYFISQYSNITTPPVFSLCNGEGKKLKELVSNDALKKNLSQYDMPVKEFFTFKTGDGVELNGWMMKPARFDAGRKYPVVMYQYSGPGSQNVTDAWGAGFYAGGVFESYLNSLGMIVVCVDGRGTGGRGADFEKCTYLNLGKLESRDQVETALYLGGLPYVDKNNIAIWGWSYGGFNTLMSMSEGRPVFKCGVAVAPPTDWRFYDTVYTERYMRTPGENGDGYDCCPLFRADKLSGELLICHGLADDNVHYQNTAEYSEALVQAGKQFEMQVYTNRNHQISGGNTREHLMNRITRFFSSRLK